LIGTTKATIQKIRERSHWNAQNIKAVDPVTLGLCSQLELDLAVSRANAKRERAIKRAEKRGETLKSIEETTAPLPEEVESEAAEETANDEPALEESGHDEPGHEEPAHEEQDN